MSPSRLVHTSAFTATCLRRRFVRQAAALLLLGIGLPAVALAVNQLTLKKTGKVMEFRSIEWRESTGEFRVDTGQGVIPIAKADIEDLQLDRPADLDKAVKLLENNQAAAAVPILEALVSSYRMTRIELEASGYLAEAYFASKSYAKAASLMEDQFKATAPDEIPLENRRLYWKALLSLKREATLSKALEEAVASPNRPFACAGRLMKADLSQIGGQREDALLEYLRVVTLYGDLKEFQPAALAGTVAALEGLRDPRADVFRKRLVQLYPASPEARRAAAAM